MQSQPESSFGDFRTAYRRRASWILGVVNRLGIPSSPASSCLPQAEVMGMSTCVGLRDGGGQGRRSFVELHGDAASIDEVVEKGDESLVSVALQVATPGVVRWQRLRQVPTGEASGVTHRSCSGLDYPVPQSWPHWPVH